MKIPPVKGTRDFYPPQMNRRNWIIDGWKSASLRNGFEEYDGPIFEHLQMYQIKSGDEIAEQLFSLKDRGGRDLAIRPEITPTLARMVNQQINTLARPIKWFSVPRLCRAERPQKGRLREFFQWNVDVIGVDDVLADAEVIFCAVDYLRQVGLTPDDIVVKISSRKMLAELLIELGLEESQLEPVYAVLDKRAKLPEDVFEKLLAEQVSDGDRREKILSLMEAESVEKISEIVEPDRKAAEAIEEMSRLFEILDRMQIGQFCKFDTSIVRGLAYYTGIVYEIHDKAGRLRAIAGGGRYDNLLKQFGGPDVSATGFGMGDSVLEILLEEKGLIGKEVEQRSIDYFIAFADSKYRDKAIETASKIRLAGMSANFSYKTAGLGKQFKEAAAQNARKVVIIGQEIEAGQLAVKDMAAGQQQTVTAEEFFRKL